MTKPNNEPEVILKGIAREILESDEFQEKLRTLGPDRIRANIINGLARLEARRRERGANIV